MKEHEIVIGTPVTYWAVIMDDGEKMYPKETVIESKHWTTASGNTICIVQGVSGGVCISHLEKR